MKRNIVVLIIGLMFGTATMAAGIMTPKDGPEGSIEIRDHDVNVVINNGFAVTTVDQVFFNPTDRDMEAVYTFPLPKNASLSELSLWIDGQEILGEVTEKEKAREIYRKEKEAGRNTAVAEKRDYLAFDVLVNPVLAGQETRVRLVYLQPIEIDGNIGRYVYPLEEGMIDEQVHSFWDMKEQVHRRFNFLCTVRSSYPIDSVRTKGLDHLAQVETESQGQWIVSINDEEGNAALNQDIVVYYRLAENTPARVDLLPFRDGQGPGTYMLVITPGNDLQPITEGIDWTVVLDLSGSMGGKIGSATDAVSRALEELRPEDRFRIALFSDNCRMLERGWQPVNKVNVEATSAKLMKLDVEGGTNLYAGLQEGLRGLETDRTSAVLLISDGGANVGPSEQKDFMELMEDKDVRVFTFVIGSGSNVPLMERIAEVSGGFSMSVSNQDDLYGRILQARSKLGLEAMHGIEVDLAGVGANDQSSLSFPTIYHGQQIVRFGRYTKHGEATLKLKARISGRDVEWETRVDFPEFDDSFPEMERLWAFAKTRELKQQIDDTGREGELREAIVDLGQTYSIVTDYTSMVVVEGQQFEEYQIERKNLSRVERERQARSVRTQSAPKPTRADSAAPMYKGRSSHGTGGRRGGGAVDFTLVWILGGSFITLRMLRRKG
ncbi:MAG: VWA domain-containing protein [Acidobacteria bacterium]|uniref:VWA domain-containing protein n=1 Tax=Candidatus Polarisedimenticola svalbardensis TaxID=2886004 RepID=A0A8J7C2L1_9BACT|nr:VWA domain-containing protein [Candidatus Polarisedimenticola svalbardensis]